MPPAISNIVVGDHGDLWTRLGISLLPIAQRRAKPVSVPLYCRMIASKMGDCSP